MFYQHSVKLVQEDVLFSKLYLLMILLALISENKINEKYIKAS